MPKISTIQTNASPVLGDKLLGVQVAGPTDVLITLSALQALIAPQRTRRAQFLINADGTGGATNSTNEGSPEIMFTGTPTSYGRGSLLVPMDYVSGTTANLVLCLRSDSANNETINYYIGSRATNGAAYTTWNVASYYTTVAGVNLTANVTGEFTLATIPAANLTAGGFVAFAVKPQTAITGNIYLTAAYLSYTASS